MKKDAATDVRLVDRHPDLEEVAARLGTAAAIGLDFEGEYNLHRYGIHLCLVQISDGDSLYVVDPVALGSLAALRTVLEDERVTKVMCSADEDVKLLKRSQGITVRGLFDLQVGSRLLGAGAVSLGRIIERTLGRVIEKKEELQRSDWNRRPLSAAQLDYAAEDVRHLLPAWRAMRDELAAKGKLAKAEEQSRALEKREFRIDPQPWTRLRGARTLGDPAQQALAALHAAREKVAEALDLPPYRVIGNDALVAAARRPPLSREGWLRLMTHEARPFVDTFAAALGAAGPEP